MAVTLIARTHFDEDAANAATGGAWETAPGDMVGNGEASVEFAGRACYQSWHRPNPATATRAGYLANILDQKHFSVLEHGSASFYITGVSRALTHELVRHRHLSFSQLSQRFVDESGAQLVIPPGFRAHETRSTLERAFAAALSSYTAVVGALAGSGMTRKQIREAARAVLPNATETKIVVTGNYRSWRHFIEVRATAQADAEIRQLAGMIRDELQQLAPNVFGDL
jgi:thymidylate synthase (FAD)